MPEPPDFEQLARRMFPVEDTGQDALAAELSAESRDNLIGMLRHVWNARGAADLYMLTGWSLVPGDCAYVQAETGPDAIATLHAEFVRREEVDDQQPLDNWKAEQMDRPVCIIHYRD